jgi:low temperature requirement protein LtrA
MRLRKAADAEGGAAGEGRHGLSFSPTGESHRVTTLELLFDLVFVFAVTSVTGLMAHDLGAKSLVEGLLILALMWFGWCAYAWLGNQARADEGPLRVSMLFAMGAYFIVALTIAQAFHARPGGLSGPGVFVVAYAVVRLSHLAVYSLAAGDDAELRRTIAKAFVSTLPALLLLGVGVFVSENSRLALWAIAVLTDYVGIFLTGGTGWRLPAPSHFAERHQLVVIIAIGESIVSVGVGLADAPVTWSLLAGALLGMTISVALWWSYFDVVALVAGRVLARLQGDDRTRLGRDTFTYLHLPIVTGIVYLALGIKIVLTQVAVLAAGRHPSFSGAAVLALYGGAALYLVAMSAVRWRDIGKPNLGRLVMAGALVLAGIVAELAQLTGLVNLVIVAAILVGLVSYETVHFKDLRARIRTAAD